MHIKESLKGLCLGYGTQVTVKACWLLVLLTPLLNFKNNDNVLLYSLHFLLSFSQGLFSAFHTNNTYLHIFFLSFLIFKN